MYKLAEEVESRYRFVTLAALRAEQLQMGAVPRVEVAHRKAILIAQQEVAEGLVGPWSPDQELAAEEAVAPEPDEEGEGEEE